jgi:hypothetical protein
VARVSTIGNATVIVYDDNPILATDPWFGGEDTAYFGSWNLSHEIPPQQKQDILNSEYIWFSHGHPDHLNPSSLDQLRGRKVLLPDHVGARIAKTLMDDQFDVSVLPDRKWINLSPNTNIMCITTSIQDAILLISVYDYLFINVNDAGTRHCTNFIRSIAKEYRYAYLLSLSGYGDADMINFFDESGHFVVPPAKNNIYVGEQLGHLAKSLRADAVIPFSSHHQYQRTDSLWAQEYVTPLHAYEKGFPEGLEFIPPFVDIECPSGNYLSISPKQIEIVPRLPEHYGDSWSDELDLQDRVLIDKYFHRKELIRNRIGYIHLVVGGKTHTVSLNPRSKKGISFELPRNSLMRAIEMEIFDDLLIGNFMKTTLHNMRSLYESEFVFSLTKYADNGRAETEEEVRQYLAEYRRRAGREYIYETFLDHSKSLVNRVLTNKGSKVRRKARSIYYRMR